MLRAFLCAAPVLAFVAAPAVADEPAKDKADDAGVVAVVVKVNAEQHTVTVKLQDADGKEVEKTLSLADAARLLDEAGKPVALDKFEAGANVVIVERGGRLAELRRARKEARAPFDVDEFIKEYDANKDGFLQKEELPERLRHAFDAIDENHDGKISKEELIKGAHLLHPRRHLVDRLRVLVEMSDVDESCAEELQAAYDFLRKLDENRDGRLDPEKLKAGREFVIKDRVDTLIKELDKNGDGKISREEAHGALRRDFDKLDLNKDGFIDRDELTKAVREAQPEPADKGPAKDEGKEPEKEPAKKKPGEGDRPPAAPDKEPAKKPGEGDRPPA